MVRISALAPREVVGGIGALVLQQLYVHCVYPLLACVAEPSVCFKANVTEVSLDFAEHSVGRILTLQLSDAVSALKADEGLVAASSRDVISTWEVRRLSGFFLGMQEEPYAYFFRVHVRNNADKPCTLETAAEFYALRFHGGGVHPLSLTPEGRGRVILKPGEMHRYAGIFVTDQWALEAVGGVVLERRELAAWPTQDAIVVSGTLASVRPAEVDAVVAGDLHVLVGNSHFVGMVDLRDVQYV